MKAKNGYERAVQYQAWNLVQNYTISEKRFKMACNLLPHLSCRKIANFIDGGRDGWNNPNHQKWLDKTDVKKIAEWVSAGLS